jgi:GT2 family glycosyltransferase
MLAPHTKNMCDLIVLDNGSTDKNEISEYTTYTTSNNCYFGGGFNLAMQLVQQNPEYDSLLFLSNDIIMHGYNFIHKLRQMLFEEDYAVASPAVIQPEEGQCHWKQMHNWGAKETRPVKWIDFMCPMLRRDVIEKIGQYDMELVYGWGLDQYTGVVCEDNNWKTGVTDTLSIIHFSAQTTKDGKSDITLQEYCSRAERGVYVFFDKIGRMDALHRMQQFGVNYTYTQSYENIL